MLKEWHKKGKEETVKEKGQVGKGKGDGRMEVEYSTGGPTLRMLYADGFTAAHLCLYRPYGLHGALKFIFSF